MNYYIKTLREQAKQASLRHEAERRDRAASEANAARERLELLDDRLRRVLAKIPEEIQREGLSLVALQTHLKGRGRGHMHCHVGELGCALRRLGFARAPGLFMSGRRPSVKGVLGAVGSLGCGHVFGLFAQDRSPRWP